MARKGGRIEPNMQRFGLGVEVGWFEVTPEEVRIVMWDMYSHEGCMYDGVAIDPDLAPLFRMVANRLDEIAGVRDRR